MDNIQGKFLGCFLGLAIGDALGHPYEWNYKNKVKGIPDKPYWNSKDECFYQPGTWTDDTSMSLCLADSLLKRGGYNDLDALYTYLRWYRSGYLSCTGKAIGTGKRTREALELFESVGIDLKYIGNPNSHGNGSLMRVAPIAMFHYKHYKFEVARLGQESSQTTHATIESELCCRFYSEMIHNALHGKCKRDILNVNYLFGLKPTVTPDAIKVIMNREYKDLKLQKSTSYVVDTFRLALYCFYNTNSFKDGALMAVNFGGDTDTVASVYGALAGAYYGYDSLPIKWLRKLKQRKTIEQYANALYYNNF